MYYDGCGVKVHILELEYFKRSKFSKIGGEGVG